MNGWNPSETPPLIRKWKPRQASPEIRARLFGAAPRQNAAIFSLDLGELARWVVPVCVGAMVVLASVSNQLQPRYAPQLASTNWGATQPEAAGAVLLAASTAQCITHSGVNAVPAKTLEWSFGTRPAALGVSSLIISYTNKLIQ